MHMLLKIKAGNGKRHRIVLFDKHKKRETEAKKKKTKRKITRDWKKRDREKKKSTH